jgi:hypothetical protein
MIATSSQSDHPGRHRPVIYALLTNNMNLNEPGDDVIVQYDEETGTWDHIGNPADGYNG